MTDKYDGEYQGVPLPQFAEGKPGMGIYEMKDPGPVMRTDLPLSDYETRTPLPEWYANVMRQRVPSKQAILRVVTLALVPLYEAACDLRDHPAQWCQLMAAELDERTATAQWRIVNCVWELLGGDGDGDKQSECEGPVPDTGGAGEGSG